jgi:hypothetical protein
MRNVILHPVLAALATLALAGTAAAQGNICGEREVIVQRLQEKYSETRQAMGLQQNNGVVEIFASSESGTWTILVTLPNGTTCLVAAGEAWDGNAELAAVPGKKT